MAAQTAPKHAKTNKPRTPRVRFWVIASIAWVAFIWLHSLVPGPESSAESGMVVQLLGWAFRLIGISDGEMMTFIVRKSAHFLEYAVLGFLLRGLCHALSEQDHSRLRAAGLTLLCICVPIIDETIQRFVPGRDGKPQDMLLDLCGALTGALITSAVLRHKASKKRRASAA